MAHLLCRPRPQSPRRTQTVCLVAEAGSASYLNPSETEFVKSKWSKRIKKQHYFSYQPRYVIPRNLCTASPSALAFFLASGPIWAYSKKVNEKRPWGKKFESASPYKNLPPLPTSRNRRAFSPYKLSYLKGVIEMQEQRIFTLLKITCRRSAKSQEWIRCYIYPPGTNEETQMLSSYGWSKMQCPRQAFTFLTTSSAKHRNSRGLSHAVKRGKLFSML